MWSAVRRQQVVRNLGYDSGPAHPPQQPPALQAAIVSAKLAELGGVPETHEISAEVEAEVEAAAPEIEAEVAAQA